jgi:hypothetical protein
MSCSLSAVESDNPNLKATELLDGMNDLKSRTRNAVDTHSEACAPQANRLERATFLVSPGRWVLHSVTFSDRVALLFRGEDTIRCRSD